MSINYNEIDKKWKDFWDKNQTYKVEDAIDKPKYYVLDMFPYPSGSGLHVGHPLGYIASDIFSRYKRMKGFNVLHPMGFDAFGLPAEEYAIQKGVHPADSTAQNMKRYREQLDNLGFSFDWSRQVNTSDPKYYKWTQWFFTELFKHYFDTQIQKARPIEELEQQFALSGNKSVTAANSQEEIFTADEWRSMSAFQQSEVLMNYRLAYRKTGFVNWCEPLGTVLANDQIKEGLSVRGGHPVTQKAMNQWYLRITAYAERMLNDLNDIAWSDALKTIQRNWIGRSEGASIEFPVVGSDDKIEVFTTRPDTIFGATYMVLAPLHDLVEKLTTEDQKTEVEEYVAYVKAKSEIQRMAEKESTGTFIGSYAINPFTNKEIPIWIGEYVLKDYGTGAIMAVPSDDERDNVFAKKFGLPIVQVIDKSENLNAGMSDKVGKIINSGFINGMEVKDAIKAVCKKVEELNIGSAHVNYKMRDANFSRQRYWGEPFPIVYNQDGVSEALSIDRLPLELPHTDDFKPGAAGKSPLARIESWVTTEDGKTRETDVMPGVAGSSWYYLRYMDPHNEDALVGEKNVNYWKDVDLYVGGSEHAVAHLMYARFWHKFLYDKGRVPTNEPFKKLINQGMIQGVIEFIYLIKEKENGQSKFICTNLAEKRNISMDQLAKIPVLIDFVKDYGSEKSYLNMKSIKNFIKYYPSYEDAVFECGNGTFHQGKFTPFGDATDTHLITHSEVGKMSKSKLNVINPDDIITQYGTDCFRMYEMFLGPIEQSKPWDTNGIEGVSKFLKKFTSLYVNDEGQWLINEEPASKEAHKVLNKTIQKIEKDIINFSMNTAVSAFMICVNDLKKLKVHNKEILQPLLMIMAPFAPFLTDEFNSRMGGTESIHHGVFPEVNEAYLKEDSFTYPVCVMGKKRALLEMPSGASMEEIEEAAKNLPEMARWFEDKEIVKTIVVPQKMVNFVVK